MRETKSCAGMNRKVAKVLVRATTTPRGMLIPGSTFIIFANLSRRHVYYRGHAYSIVQSIVGTALGYVITSLKSTDLHYL